MSLEPGSHLHQHRYRIRKQLGKGGMGTVYLAEDLNLAGRFVAIKENLNNDEEAQRQFRREAVLLAHLRHPNLPQVIDYFLEPDGRQYLVMEYVPGENLHEIIRTHGPLPVSEALACIEQVMLAVAYMHNQRNSESGHRRAIVHRDIKPANIKRTPEGRYILVDFGIAKQHSATLRSTAVSARALTPGFAPIEQYGGGTDERSDIYALGATLYVHMYSAITGRPIPTSPITTSSAPSRARSTRPNRTFAWLFGALALLSVVGVWWLFASSAPQPDLGAQAAFVATATPVSAAALAPSATALPTRDDIGVETLDVAVLSTPTPDAATIAAANTTITSFLATVGATVVGAIPSPMRTPLPTSTPIATSTPRPTNTPTATPIAIATLVLATVAAPAPADGATDGPTSAQIIQPGDNHSSNTATLFKWVANAPLAPGQEFEIIFWKANGETEAQGRGLLRSSPASEVTQPVDVLAPDAYKWALILVQAEPTYLRLRTLAGPYTFTVPASGKDQKNTNPMSPPLAPSR